MEFVNGKHLANYLLKIFKNNGIDVPSEDVEEIKNLDGIFTFISNLPTDIKNNIDLSNGYYPWIILAQSNKYKNFQKYHVLVIKTLLNLLTILQLFHLIWFSNHLNWI